MFFSTFFRDREKRQDRFRALYAANGVDVVDTTGCLTAVETEKAANIADDPPLVADKLTEDAMNDVVMAWNSNANNKKKKAQRGRQARPVKTNSYADYLMFSEWLVDIPCELSTEWLMVPCPLGKRCLVVSENVGICICNDRHMRLYGEFYSGEQLYDH